MLLLLYGYHHLCEERVYSKRPTCNYKLLFTAGRMHLLKAADENKDQTYFLSHVSPEQLKNIVFPIGDLTKIEVKKIAATHGLREAAERKEVVYTLQYLYFQCYV